MLYSVQQSKETSPTSRDCEGADTPIYRLKPCAVRSLTVAARPDDPPPAGPHKMFSLRPQNLSAPTAIHPQFPSKRERQCLRARALPTPPAWATNTRPAKAKPRTVDKPDQATGGQVDRPPVRRDNGPKLACTKEKTCSKISSNRFARRISNS